MRARAVENVANTGASQKKPAWRTFINVALAALLVALLCGIGGTFAAMTDAMKHTSNQEYAEGKLVWGRNEGVTSTTDDGTNRIVPTQERSVVVAAQNTGTQDMFARIKFNFKWVACEKSADGTTYTKVKDINEADSATVSNGALFKSEYLSIVPDTAGSDAKWENGEDGYFYYNQGDVPISPAATTGNLCATVEMSEEVGETFNNNLHHELSAEENRYVEYAADGTQAAVYYTGVEVDAQLEAVSQPYEQTAGETSSATSGEIAKTGDELGLLVAVLVAVMLASVHGWLPCLRENAQTWQPSMRKGAGRCQFEGGGDKAPQLLSSKRIRIRWASVHGWQPSMNKSADRKADA